MAQRRMFSPDIVGSDAFFDMPTSSQALYFHLGMYADDDGFVNPKKIMRMMGAGDDDLKVLITKRFVLPFENGVVVIKHWRINNLVRKDWYKETQYVEEKKELKIKDNGAYTEFVNEPLTTRQHRLGKVSIGKVRIEEDMSAVADAFDSFWNQYPKKELKKKSREIWERKKLDSRLEEILRFIQKAIETDRWKKGYVKQPTAFLNGECWNDELSSYGDVKKIEVYRNDESDEETKEKFNRLNSKVIR